MYQQFYQRFLQANQGRQHFACHSHHYWPDVSRDAMLEYWDDTARLVDDKWRYIFGEKVPQTQQLIAFAERFYSLPFLLLMMKETQVCSIPKYLNI